MAFVFVLIGGMLGGLMGGLPGAVIGAVVAPLLWGAFRNSRSKPSPDSQPSTDANLVPPAMTLASRVQALEAEVAALRSQVSRLSQGGVVPGPVESLAGSLQSVAEQRAREAEAQVASAPAIDVPLPAKTMDDAREAVSAEHSQPMPQPAGAPSREAVAPGEGAGQARAAARSTD